MGAMKWRTGRKPPENADLLMVFGPMLFLVGIFVSSTEQTAVGVLLGLAGVAMMLAWWMRRQSKRNADAPTSAP